MLFRSIRTGFAETYRSGICARRLRAYTDLRKIANSSVCVPHTQAMRAAILTIGNELVSGDVENTNASWLARRLESIGVRVVLSASIPDELDTIVEFVRREGARVDVLLVTGGLGGTPDDITREALAAAYDVPQVEVAELAADLRARFSWDPDYAARWALLPEGSRPLVNPRGDRKSTRLNSSH